MKSCLIGSLLFVIYDFYKAVVELKFFAVERQVFYFAIFVYSMVVLQSISKQYKKESELLASFAEKISIVLEEKSELENFIDQVSLVWSEKCFIEFKK